MYGIYYLERGKGVVVYIHIIMQKETIVTDCALIFFVQASQENVDNLNLVKHELEKNVHR